MTVKEIVSRISKDQNGCWLWYGALQSQGYGYVRIKGKMRRIHIVIYECFKGPVPEDFELDHRCEIKHCCNPSHLKVASHRENARRRSAKKLKKTHCVRGHSYEKDGYYLNWRGNRLCRKCHENYFKSRKNV